MILMHLMCFINKLLNCSNKQTNKQTNKPNDILISINQSYEFMIFHISSPITLIGLPTALIMCIRLPDKTAF